MSARERAGMLARALLLGVAGRSLTWRAGRAAYCWARGDDANDMAHNGEALLQERACAAGRGPLVAFDVGANVGEWSARLLGAAARRGRALELHAFEPVPGTFAILSSRLAPHAGAIHLRQLAMSSAEGEIDMRVSEGGAGTNTLVAAKGAERGELVRVRRATLDSYAGEAGIPRVDLLKVDTEGHDLEVLLGARGLLGRGAIGVAQFEYNHLWVHARHYLRDAFELAGEVGYRVGKVTRDGLVAYERWHPELERFFEANYLLVHPDLLRPLGVAEGRFDGSNVLVTRPPR